MRLEDFLELKSSYFQAALVFLREAFAFGIVQLGTETAVSTVFLGGPYRLYCCTASGTYLVT